MLELKRPHGFLMWKGKKRAVLRPHGEPLLIGDELEVCTGDEAFGVAVLASPAQMLVSEVDRKEYFEDHRVRPKEREEWWPGETRFLVYPVESFEAYKETAKPESFRDLEKGGGSVPYEIVEKGDEHCVVKKDSGEVVKCHASPEKAAAHLAALRINVEAEEKQRILDQMLELAEAAKKVEAEEKEAETGFSREAKQRILDGVLEMAKAADELEAEPEEGEKGQLKKLMQQVLDLRAELAATKAAPKKTVDGTEYPAGAFLVVEDPDKPSTWHLRFKNEDDEVDHRLMGAAWAALHGGYRGNKYEGPDKAGALRKLKALYENEGMEVPGGKGAEPADLKAGRRIKKTMRQRIREAWEVLGEVLKWADGPQREPTMADLFKASPDAGFMVKAVGGEPWLFTWSANAFKDRDDEIFTTKGLEEYVLENEQKDERGWFNFWHVPGTDFAEKKWQGVVGDTGGVLLEAGPFSSNKLGRRAMEFFTKFPNGHPEVAPEGWGCSVEYRYLPKEKQRGVYEKFWVTRTSILPRMAAANTWTKGGITMALTKKQREGVEAAFPDEAEDLLKEAEDHADKLKEEGVEHKDAQEEKAMDAAKVAKAIQKLAGESDDKKLSGKLLALAKTLGEDDEEPEEKEKEASEPEPVAIDLEALGKEIAKQFDVQLEPVVEMQKMLEAQGGKLDELEVAVAKYKRAEKVRQDENIPRAILSWETKASEAEETALAEDDPLLKMKPAETKPASGSGADHFFGPVKR